MNDVVDNIFKILLLGNSEVGKTCFLTRFTDNTFQELHLSTVGLDYRVQDIKMDDGKVIKVQIWDTAGQDRFKSITRNYFKGADGILLLYDVTSSASFNSIRTWISQIKENASLEVKIIIVGNKIDLRDQIEVSTEDVKKLAAEFKLPFFEASAKGNIKIDLCFNTLIADIYKDYVTSTNEAMRLGGKNKGDGRCC